MTKLVISTSEFQSQVADFLPSNKRTKSQLTHSLIKSYSLLKGFDYIITKPKSSIEELAKFHSSAYLSTVLNRNLNQNLSHSGDEWIGHINDFAPTLESENNDDDIGDGELKFTCESQLYAYFKEIPLNKEVTSRKRSFSSASLTGEVETVATQGEAQAKHNLKLFNLEGDCPLFSYLPMYCQVIAGATLMLVDYIDKVEPTVAVNWDGGRHHALKSRASGFCYVNDIVLLIQKLRGKSFQKMTYIDFDLHHGDGVEKAFQFSSNVQTVSLHMYEPGFFPCTGSLEDTKKGKSIVNVPLLHGLDDDYLRLLIEKIIIPLVDKHEPEVLIIQCGGDGLIGDSYEEWQLTIRGLVECITTVMKKFTKCSFVLLGGGGYNNTLMSRFYTYLTWKLLKMYEHDFSLTESLEFGDDELIPEHDYIDSYADEYYKFWAYEQDGSLKKKTLRNDNVSTYVSTLQNFYHI